MLGRVLDVINHAKFQLEFNSIGSGVFPDPQVVENCYLPLPEGIALTTVYALACYTVIILSPLSGHIIHCEP